MQEFRSLSPGFEGLIRQRVKGRQGKTDLLANLATRLKGYSRWITDDYKLVVLIDEDRAEALVAGKGASGGVAETASLTEKGRGAEAADSNGGEEEMVDYELFCAELARVCPSCPKAAKAA